MGYDAVIFDKDGVLLDSGDFKWADKIRIKIAKSKGKDIDIEQAEKIVHTENIEQLHNFLKDTGLKNEDILEMEEEIADTKIQMMKDGDIDLIQSAENVLENLDMPKAIVSNAPMVATAFTLKFYGIERFFSYVKSPKLGNIEGYIDRKKPSPEMIKETVDAMECENPVMVGDSEDDIQAAKNAGIDSIHVDYNGKVESDPTYEVDELDEIVGIINS